jgi:uncharacterized protein VirK/YbjX
MSLQQLNMAGLLRNLKWLWNISAAIWEDQFCYGRATKFAKARVLRSRIEFVIKGARLIVPLRKFMHPEAGSLLARALAERPVLAGAVVWPYICSRWKVGTSLEKIAEHFGAIEAMQCLLDFPSHENINLIDLSERYPGLSVKLDQARWFVREGLLVINLFQAEQRIYSLAFSFAFEEGKIVAYIGAIQGVDAEGIKQLYKELGKHFHGMRPKVLLVELFRIFCRCLKVYRIYAVNENARHHRSSYFGEAIFSTIFQNYDSMWESVGGVAVDENFYALALESPFDNLTEAPIRKHAIYKLRSELLQSLERRLMASLDRERLAKDLHGRSLSRN